MLLYLSAKTFSAALTATTLGVFLWTEICSKPSAEMSTPAAVC